MAGFASMIDALGGVSWTSGRTHADRRRCSPSAPTSAPGGYSSRRAAAVGKQALRSPVRAPTPTDYARMGRQRCLMQTISRRRAPRTCSRTSRASPRPRPTASRRTSPRRSCPRSRRWRATASAGQRLLRPVAARPLSAGREVQSVRPRFRLHAPDRRGGDRRLTDHGRRAHSGHAGPIGLCVHRRVHGRHLHRRVHHRHSIDAARSRWPTPAPSRPRKS